MEFFWTDFVNSEWHDWRGSGRSEDRLAKRAWLEAFLRAQNLTAPMPPTAEDMAALNDLRRLIRRLAESYAQALSPQPEDIRQLNRVLAAGPVVRQISIEADDLRVKLVPVHRTWAQVMAEVAASFAHTLEEGEGSRIRICENPDCRWVFYDDTRNRSKKFCDDRQCGNLIKVRRFRARRRAPSP